MLVRWRRNSGRVTRTGWVMICWGIFVATLSIACTIGIVWAAVHFAHKYW